MNSEIFISKGYHKLVTVIREAGDIVHIADAERALNVSRSDAAKLLSRWDVQGPVAARWIGCQRNRVLLLRENGQGVAHLYTRI